MLPPITYYGGKSKLAEQIAALPPSTSAARRPDAPSSGFGTACAAVETFSKQLAVELGPRGVRVLCLRPDGMPETAQRGSHAAHIWGRFAEKAGLTLEEFLDQPSGAPLQRGVPLRMSASGAK